MKLKLLFFTFLYSTSTIIGIAQTKEIDSLKNKLTTAENDSVKIRVLIALTTSFMYISYQDARKYADEALSLAEKNNWNWARAVSYSRQGYLGTIRGDHRRALEYDNKNLKIVLANNDSAKLCVVYNDIGNDYLELGEFQEAYYYVTQSYEISKKVNELTSAGIAMHNLAVMYSKLGRMDLALSHFNESAKLSAAAKDEDGPSYNDHELGNAYLREKKHKEASQFLFQSLAQSKKRGISILVPRVYQSIGDLYSSTSDYKKAFAYYDSAIQDFGKNENLFGVTEAQLGKVKVLLKQKKFREATDLALASRKTADELKAQVLLSECFKVLSTCSEMQGDYKTALIFNKHAQETQDSLTSINVMSQVFENEFQMRSQQKDKELETLRKVREQSMYEIKRQEFIRNIFAVVFALTIVLLYSVYKSGRRKVEINDLLMKHQQEIEKRTVELEELNKVKDKFFSIISHDLRSPINSLAGLLDLMEKNQIKADELPALTREMRIQFNHTKNLITNLLDWTLLQMNKVAIKKEKLSIKSIVDDNIKLLSSMKTKDTTFINEVGDDIQALADNNMINLIFRNLILNGIKFTDNGGVIKISATQDNKQITVMVNDNGVGISDDVRKVLFEKTTGYSTRGTANEKGTGLGLILCKEFVERNGGTIWLESEIGKGSTFYVTLPVS